LEFFRLFTFKRNKIRKTTSHYEKHEKPYCFFLSHTHTHTHHFLRNYLKIIAITWCISHARNCQQSSCRSSEASILRRILYLSSNYRISRLPTHSSGWSSMSIVAN